ncbi:endonuclease/exonuclease/phosphatase family protein [Janibacter indicus]|uniref:Endonuclease/exonuclease/phosphatase family protein n=1 Tax=Janibacter indicus TaxID=857417 RepID=A0A7L9J393_9MICO|nr:endonuclease/exonuclease/phosphatase family protein [Janibacter indicus]QOK24076.1 endonuclease/exonuclease/phosphatase family protein [Janibacter indicus]
MSLRVASYNVRALQDDVAALARTVRAIDPDVLCLQEVPWIGPVDHRIADFARRCGLVWSGRDQRAGQTSVLTHLRTNVVSVTHHRLPYRTRRDRRGFAVTRVAPFGRTAVSVASVHLGLDGDERLEHAREIMAHLAAQPGPALLAGDLNEQDDGAAWQLFGGAMRPVSPLEPTFPSGRPEHVLDVVFATPDVRVLPHRDVPWVAEDLTAGTDHRPVWVDVETAPLTGPLTGPPVTVSG